MSRAGRLGKLALGSTVVGGGLGCVMYYQRLSQNKAVTGAEWNALQDKEQMKLAMSWVQQASAASRSAATGSATAVVAGPVLELYRYTTCPYCGKVKAFLDYYGIPHKTVEVEPMFKSQLGESKYKKLPQLRFGGEGGAYLVDSDLVVDTLAELVGSGAQLRDAKVQRWRAWCRDSLVRHVTLNINTSLVEAWRGYAYIDAFDTIPMVNKIFLKVVGAPVMFLVAKYKTRPTLVKAGELAEGDDVREVFHRQVNHYVSEAGISDKKPFHGGARPDLADLEVYGVLQSVRFHKVYDDLLHSTNVAPWLTRMDSELGKKAYAPSALTSAAS